MKKTAFFDKINTVYFIGIGGVFMSALAKYCIVNGKTVCGSDRERNDLVGELISIGAKIKIGHRADNLDSADVVVYTSAINKDNPEYVKAIESGVPVLKRSEFLSAILSDFSEVVAVAGCHGKTTVTSMITHALDNAGFSPTAFIGGEDKSFGNFLSGEKGVAITEACEYEKNFLDISPTVAVVLNIDDDHQGSYNGMQDMINVYGQFSRGAFSVINADDTNCAPIIKKGDATFGIERTADFKATDLRQGEKGYAFTLYVGGVKKARVRLSVKGRYNVYNALAAIAASVKLGVPIKKAVKAVSEFTSVKRRTEYLGKRFGRAFYADYAHHPSEIKQVLSVFPENCLIVFQPHTYSRTAALMEKFTDVFSDREVIIYKTYPAREKYDRAGDGYTLYLSVRKNNTKVKYAKNVAALKSFIEKSGLKSVAFIGAGDIYGICKSFFVKGRDKF